MISRSIAVALGTCLVAVCSSASAATTEDKQQGWYIGAGAGYAKNALDNLYLTPDSTEKKNATGFKLYGGYQFNQNWAAEMTYINFGKYSIEDNQSIATAKAAGVGISAVGLLPLSEQFTLLGKVGALAKMTDTQEHFVDGTHVYSQKATRIAPLLGVGAEYRLTPAMSVRAEYEYAGKTSVGEKDTMLTNQLLSVSLRYQF